MTLFLAVAAFLLSVSAMVVGIEVLRRIKWQNEEFRGGYVQKIRRELSRQEEEITSLRREIRNLKAMKKSSLDTLHKLEQNTSRKRAAQPEPFIGKGKQDYGDFIPSTARTAAAKSA